MSSANILNRFLSDPSYRAQATEVLKQMPVKQVVRLCQNNPKIWKLCKNNAFINGLISSYVDEKGKLYGSPLFQFQEAVKAINKTLRNGRMEMTLLKVVPNKFPNIVSIFWNNFGIARIDVEHGDKHIEKWDDPNLDTTQRIEHFLANCDTTMLDHFSMKTEFGDMPDSNRGGFPLLSPYRGDDLWRSIKKHSFGIRKIKC